MELVGVLRFLLPIQYKTSQCGTGISLKLLASSPLYAEIVEDTSINEDEGDCERLNPGYSIIEPCAWITCFMYRAEKGGEWVYNIQTHWIFWRSLPSSIYMTSTTITKVKIKTYGMATCQSKNSELRNTRILIKSAPNNN